MARREDRDHNGRRSIRLPGHDYGSDGTYFVTICTRDRVCLFGEVGHGIVRLNELGSLAALTWSEIGQHFRCVVLDDWVLMPNHLHGIIVLARGTGPGFGVEHIARRPGFQPPSKIAVSRSHPIGPGRGSLGAIVGSFKSATTKRINRLRLTPGVPVWQRGYYERILRDQAALNRIRSYIVTNPSRWSDGGPASAPPGYRASQLLDVEPSVDLESERPT